MKRDKTIKYITETSIEDMVKSVKESGRDVESVIKAALDSRKEYGLKVQDFVQALKSK